MTVVVSDIDNSAPNNKSTADKSIASTNAVSTTPSTITNATVTTTTTAVEEVQFIPATCEQADMEEKINNTTKAEQLQIDDLDAEADNEMWDNPRNQEQHVFLEDACKQVIEQFTSMLADIEDSMVQAQQREDSATNRVILRQLVILQMSVLKGLNVLKEALVSSDDLVDVVAKYEFTRYNFERSYQRLVLQQQYQKDLPTNSELLQGKESEEVCFMLEAEQSNVEEDEKLVSALQALRSKALTATMVSASNTPEQRDHNIHVNGQSIQNYRRDSRANSGNV